MFLRTTDDPVDWSTASSLCIATELVVYFKAEHGCMIPPPDFKILQPSVLSYLSHKLMPSMFKDGCILEVFLDVKNISGDGKVNRHLMQ